MLQAVRFSSSFESSLVFLGSIAWIEDTHLIRLMVPRMRATFLEDKFKSPALALPGARSPQGFQWINQSPVVSRERGTAHKSSAKIRVKTRQVAPWTYTVLAP